MIKSKFIHIKQRREVEKPFYIDIELFNCDGMNVANFTIYHDSLPRTYREYFEVTHASYKTLANIIGKELFKFSNMYSVDYDFSDEHYIYLDILQNI